MIYNIMGIFISICLIVLAFGVGMAVAHFRCSKRVEQNKCPFQNACTVYNEVETKAAIKRILTLLLENKISSEDIKKEIEKSLSS